MGRQWKQCQTLFGGGPPKSHFCETRILMEKAFDKQEFQELGKIVKQGNGTDHNKMQGKFL